MIQLPRPTISVSIISFNQANFIAKTLEGVLSQETNFTLEILVSDDCSTDGTQDIIADFANRFPELIHANYNSVRKGMKQNFLQNLGRCRGRFIALCDGDDLWTDTRKLELQTSFLLENSDCATVFHRVRHESRRGRLFQELPLPAMRKQRATVEDLVWHGTFMPTSSVMFRNVEGRMIPEWFWRLENIVDLPLNILNATRGDIGYIDETLGIYRTASSPSAFSARPGKAVYEETFRMYDLMIENFEKDFQRGLRTYQVRVLRHLFVLAVLDKQQADAVFAKARLRRFKQKHGFVRRDAFDGLAQVALIFAALNLWALSVWLCRKYGLRFV